MTSKKKYIKLTQEQLQDQIAIASNIAYNRGMEDGVKKESSRVQFQRIELVYKLINSIGQSQAQFASMLHEDGVIAKLLR